eukprot:scaffold666075_cov60-Prasinocladus_malaysianus.AAC.1
MVFADEDVISVGSLATIFDEIARSYRGVIVRNSLVELRHSIKQFTHGPDRRLVNPIAVMPACPYGQQCHSGQISVAFHASEGIIVYRQTPHDSDG